MSKPLTAVEREQGLLTLRSLEGDGWLFPAGMSWEQERRRIAVVAEGLAAEFGRCRSAISQPAQDTYGFSPHSGTLITKRRRPGGTTLVVVVCTFGIATVWPLAHPGRLAPLLGGSQWTPRWWDDASVSVGRAIARAVRRIGEAGYAYIPDPVFDEPYDGRIHRSDMVSWPDWAGMRWIDRYFEHVRYPHSSTGYEHASAAKRLADP